MKQPEALRLAKELVSVHKGHADEGPSTFSEAAAELRRLHEANQAMLEKLNNIKYGLEGSRIWDGMGWTYNPLHPFKYLPLIDKAIAAIAKGEQQ